LSFSLRISRIGVKLCKIMETINFLSCNIMRDQAINRMFLALSVLFLLLQSNLIDNLAVSSSKIRLYFTA